MRFWDSSAVLPLLLQEPDSARLEALARQDPAITVWWGTPIECVSAVARLEREAKLERADASLALERLRAAASQWIEVPASERVRSQAIRLLRIHQLRAGDSLQLAAAIVAADFETAALELVTLDRRLADAAAREGFQLG